LKLSCNEAQIRAGRYQYGNNPRVWEWPVPSMPNTRARIHTCISVSAIWSMFQNWKPVYKEKNEKEEGEEVDFKHNQGRKRKFPYIWSMIITGV
jgi:hypothetical protein